MTGNSKVKRNERRERPAAPLSMTVCWDKAKWHFDGDFPKDLPQWEAWAHIAGVFRFLDERRMLTAEGKRELASIDEETGLGAEHVKRAAQAFLDEIYHEFIERCCYGQPPDIAFLESQWCEYEQRFNLKKRVHPNPFQKLLLTRSYDHTLNTLFRRLNHDAQLIQPIVEAVPFAPPDVRPLVEAVIAVFTNGAESIAENTDHPEVPLSALVFSTNPAGALSRWRSLAILLKRFDGLLTTGKAFVSVGQILAQGRLPHVVADMNRAVGELSKQEKSLLASAANQLFRDAETRSLGKTAMSNVGNAESILLLDNEPPSDAELQGGGSPTPLWVQSRNRVKKEILARMPSAGRS